MHDVAHHLSGSHLGEEPVAAPAEQLAPIAAPGILPSPSPSLSPWLIVGLAALAAYAICHSLSARSSGHTEE